MAAKPSYSASKLARAKKHNNISILFAGETGSGKSTLLNEIAENYLAEVSDSTYGCTKEVTPHKRTIAIPDGDRIEVTLYDSPGLNDNEISADEIYSMMVEKTSKTVDGIIYCFDSSNRFRKSDGELLNCITRRFGKDIWKHTVFALTKADRVVNERKLKRKRDGTSQAKEVDFDERKEQFQTRVCKALVLAGVSKEVAENIPFVFTSTYIDDTFGAPEFHEHGAKSDFTWKEQLLLYMLHTIKVQGFYALMELKWSVFSRFWKDHPYFASAIGITVSALTTALLNGQLGSAKQFQTVLLKTGGLLLSEAGKRLSTIELFRNAIAKKVTDIGFTEEHR